VVFSSKWFTPCFTPRLRVPSIIPSHHRPTAHATHAAQGPSHPHARHVTGPPPPPPHHRTAGQQPAAPARVCPPARPPVRPPARPPAAFFTSAGLLGWAAAPRPRPPPAPTARAPPGLHVALDPSPIDLRRWAFFGHPLHAEVEESSLPGRPVGLGYFRPFPNVITGPSSSFCGSEQP
jgi:hypothetical protein